jgi:hypothetical protein
MDTDQLEHAMNELCHEWMHGKAPTDGVFGTVQAAARVFTPGPLDLDGAGSDRPDRTAGAGNFRAWLQSIPREREALCAPGLQREGHDPEALTTRCPTSRRRGLAPGRAIFFGAPAGCPAVEPASKLLAF